jgi:hypothetical protein
MQSSPGHDTVFQPDQGVPAQDLIDELLASASGPNNTLTIKDVSAALTRRRTDSRRRNGQYTQNLGHKMFGSSKYVS